MQERCKDMISKKKKNNKDITWTRLGVIISINIIGMIMNKNIEWV